ncbi:MAG TPA: DUF1289 domain-containing protein [Burkholderiaceae bacterium]|nr:DUF1289 domain-containing protein [Burkholderiaceae bacterium]
MNGPRPLPPPRLQVPADGPVGSPCISVCRINEATGLCEGCLRTIDEIAAWGSLDDDARRRVLRDIAGRHDALFER